jgi:POT family proton-dependent oligopeptide transporter
MASRSFFGHPLALSTVFFAEVWERFSYYGMRALLVLFLVDAVAHGGMGLDDRTATAIYGLYTASVYVVSLPGGWIADRILGGQRAVLWGAILIACGHAILGFSGTSLAFFGWGLVVIVLGTSLQKPNIAALVAEMYPEGGARRDAGFTVFYMAINLGAALGPLVTGWLAVRYGWHAGFFAAAVGMVFGIVWYVATRRWLGPAGLLPPERRPTRGQRGGAVAVTIALLAVVAVMLGGAVPVSAVTLQGAGIWVILGATLAYFVYLLGFAGLDAAERRRIVVVGVLFVGASAFWAGFEQAGSSLNLFAERFTQRMIGAFEIPASWFQSLNAIFIIAFAPVFSALWLRLAARSRDLSAIAKFVFGLLGMAGGFLAMAAAAGIVASGSLAAPTWLVLTYLLHTWGELCLSPIGMSATSQLVPQRFVGQSMGIWYTTLAFGNLIASRIAGEFDAGNVGAMPGQYLRIVAFGVGAALLMLMALPLVRRATPAAAAAPASAAAAPSAPQ